MNAQRSGKIAILGVFNADMTFRAARQPNIGETIHGDRFDLGAGGKGSNQAVAAGRLGADVAIITKLGQDPFAELALRAWREAGVRPIVQQIADPQTGAAFIFVAAGTGDNAIIVAPGAAATLSAADLDLAAAEIETADIFLTQLEQPVEAAQRGLQIARQTGATTILNPAPAAALSPELLALCDWLTPNASEAAAMTGAPVNSLADAESAATALLAQGVGGVIVTMGEHGALLKTAQETRHTPALSAGEVVETTGAGDAFNAGFAVALSRGETAPAAAQYAAAAAGLSVTRAGAASSMPTDSEVRSLLQRLS
ncbi:MAG: ribokinase [Neomegalonema sp.]|nr:ribokinase [Neomegalonema sp.]